MYRKFENEGLDRRPGEGDYDVGWFQGQKGGDHEKAAPVGEAELFLRRHLRQFRNNGSLI